MSSVNITFQQLRNKLAAFGLDGFILGLITAVVIAYLKPGLGSETSPLPLKAITTYGVIVIFFFYGLKLSPDKLRSGLSNIQLHVLIQSATFLLFPLVVWAAYLLAAPEQGNLIWTGVFFVAALPSTVSTSVVMVSVAGGNIPAAIFNASISSLIGVIMTPLWMGIFLQSSDARLDTVQVIIDLVLQVILPVGLGILLNPVLGKYVAKSSNRLRIFDQTIILLIVFMSFCHSFEQDLYSKIPVSRLLLIALGMLILFTGIYYLIRLISRSLGFSQADQITACFCGSKKSLVHGTVMSSVLFKGHPSVGVILLPLMMYHTFQLIAASIIAQKMSKRSNYPTA